MSSGADEGQSGQQVAGQQVAGRLFAGQRVVIVGLARQGSALARFFCAQGARVIVTDLASPEGLRAQIDALADLSSAQVGADAACPIEYVLGEHPLSLLDGCDLLCLSGGVPPETPLPQEARRRGIPLSNDSLLTLSLSAAPLIGITGSSGKTTTTTLVGEMLRASEFNTWIGGNIGTPLIDRVSEIAPSDKVVLELSSFQLQLFDASPHVSAVLNITPNHLDRHPSMAHYAAAKANALRYQQPVDNVRPVAVLGVDSEVTGRWWREGWVDIAAGPGQPTVRFQVDARTLGFSLDREVPEGAFLRGDRVVWRDRGREAEICSVDELLLLGRHNIANVLAACAISGVVGATPDGMRRVATTFAGVRHRLELVRELRGVRWYNDSIATAPERVVAALNAFGAPTGGDAPAEPRLILLAGGRDKHLPWAEMARITVERVRHVFLFGEAADLIANAVAAMDRGPGQASRVQVHRCDSLERAVQRAALVARRGDVVLLSPGGTSYDAYRDFEERGKHFCSLVRALR